MAVQRRAGAAVFFMIALAASATRVGGQDLSCEPDDFEVQRVSFEGNRAFRDAELANAVATTPSSWARRHRIPLLRGTKRCLNPLELQRDVFRLRYFYRQRGYYSTRVDTVVSKVRPGNVTVNFRVIEGTPVLIDSLVITGLDTLRNGDRLAGLLRPLQGKVFDKIRVQTAIDSIVERLHDNGYSKAQALFGFDVPDTAQNLASVQVDFVPGRVARIGEIRIVSEPAQQGEAVSIPDKTVLDLLSFEKGDIFREREFFRSQRDLYQLDAYRHVEIQLAPDSLQPADDSLLIVYASLAEREMRSVRLGAGWATLDCFRSQVRYTDRDFLGGARRLEVNGRLTKIGVGAPLDGAGAFCRPSVRSDPFSEKLNYYGGVTLRDPTLFGLRNVPTFTLFSERRSEFKAYQRTIPFGGIASVRRELRPRMPLNLAYQIEYGRTDAEPAVFCSVFNVCSLNDVATLTRSNRLAVLSAAISRDRTDNPFDPGRGDQIRLELRHASVAVGSDPSLQFNKWLGDAAYYRRFLGTSVLAARLQVGGVLALGSLRGADKFVPPQERLYGGGASSVRGYNQNELGPVVYIVDRFDTLITGGDTTFQANPADVRPRRASPSGGNSLVVANLELRVRSPFLPELVQWVFFTDAGQVYNRASETVNFGQFKVTPGTGLRVASPVGPLRLDVAYNGYPSRAGAAYFVQPASSGDTTVDATSRTLLCVSPGNDLPKGIGENCPRTFSPPRRTSFFSRLTLHFSIGQAF